jgi:RND family efflux transporter MFP subunit
MNRLTVRARRGRVLVPFLVVLLLAALLAAGALPRLKQAERRAQETVASTAVPTVYTELVKRDTGATKLDLPASVSGLHETGIYARTNGFVKSLRVDLGSVVRAGDTLATLDMPDVAEQLRQAKAIQEQTEATATLARATFARWRTLAEKDAVTKQELDEKQGATNVAEANLRAARASVANLSEVLRFGALTAPFSGIITARNIEIGGLVSSGAVTGNRSLFTIIQIDTLRAMVNVPQSSAANVKVGQKADIVVHDLGNATFPGTVALTARAIDPLTRTLLTEIHVTNADRRLLPGMFAHVSLTVPAVGRGIRVPAIALIIRGDGTQVARVENGTVHLTKIVLGRDFGTTLEVLSGIEPGAEVVVNPSEQIADGATVKAVRRGGAKTPAK